MRTLNAIVVASGLGLALVGSTPVSQAAPPGTNAASSKDSSSAPGQGKGGNGSDKKSGKEEYPDKVKKMLDELKAARFKFLQEQKDLQHKWKDADEADRDKIRQEMRDKRDQFLEQERDMREEFMRRVNDLKNQLKDHGDLIDNAKDPARDRTKPRKGGAD